MIGNADRVLRLSLAAWRVASNCGKTDFVFESATALDKLLTDKGINHKYTVTEGGHTSSNWRYYLSEYAPMLFRKN